jgi:hypothetical protein
VSLYLAAWSEGRIEHGGAAVIGKTTNRPRFP